MNDIIVNMCPDPNGRLQEILNTMDIPVRRKTDIRWLARNISVKNAKHPDINEALFIIEGLLLQEIENQMNQ